MARIYRTKAGNHEFYTGSTKVGAINSDGSVAATTVTATTSMSTDTISEKTSAAGVTIDGVLLKDGAIAGFGCLPIGSIVAWQGGYYTNGSNGSFANVLGNSVANANTYLNPFGIYVCNGAALNDSASPIFNAAGRYLPNLTDSRFLMGSTTAGTSGGENANSHTHSVTSNVSVAAHTITQPTFDTQSHYHSMTGAGTTLANAASAVSVSINKNQWNTDQPAHTHPVTSINGQLWSEVTVAAGVYSRYPNAANTSGRNNAMYADGNTASWNSANATGSGTAAGQALSGSIGNVSSGRSGDGTVAATRTQDVELSGHSMTNPAVNSQGPTDTENRPLYLSVFYVMRIK